MKITLRLPPRAICGRCANKADDGELATDGGVVFDREDVGADPCFACGTTARGPRAFVRIVPPPLLELLARTVA